MGGVPSLLSEGGSWECQSDGDIMGLDWTAQVEAEHHVTEVDAQIPPSSFNEVSPIPVDRQVDRQVDKLYR